MVSLNMCTDFSPARLLSPQRALWLVLLALLAGCQSQPASPPAPVEDTGQKPASQPAAPQETAPAPDPAEEPGVSRVIKVLQHRADQHGRREEWLSAIEVAEQGLRIDRRHSPFYRILAQSYQALGDPAAAFRFARQARRFCQQDCSQLDRLLERLSAAGP